MRKIRKIMLYAMLLFLTSWTPLVHSAEINDYTGNWEGDVNLVYVDKTETVHIIISFSSVNESLTGTVTEASPGNYTSQPFTATITNEELNFQFPNMDTDNPGCANWNLPTTATLNSSKNIIYISSSGTDCYENQTLDGELSKIIPSIEQYVGLWKGDVSIQIEGESGNLPISLNLRKNNDSLVGTLTGYASNLQDIQGAVTNGIFEFPIPVSDPSNPDCSSWNLPATASLDSSGTLMHFTASGTVCGPDAGGKAGTVDGFLSKFQLSLTPVMSILLKGND